MIHKQNLLILSLFIFHFLFQNVNQMIGSRTHPYIQPAKHSSWKRPKNPFRVSHSYPFCQRNFWMTPFMNLNPHSLPNWLPKLFSQVEFKWYFLFNKALIQNAFGVTRAIRCFRGSKSFKVALKIYFIKTTKCCSKSCCLRR